MSCRADYCLTSDAIREYGSSAYCLAKNSESSTYSASSSASIYDQADRGSGGYSGDQIQSVSYTSGATPGSWSAKYDPQLSVTVPASVVNEQQTALAQLSQAINGLQQPILSLQTSAASSQKKLGELSKEVNTLRELLSNPEQIQKALKDRIQQRAQSAKSLDCSLKGYVDAGLEKMVDDMMPSACKLCGYIIKHNRKATDAVEMEISENMNSFTKGIVEHHQKCHHNH